MDQDPGFRIAVDEAKAGDGEGGVPIGSCLVSREGKVLGKGRNMRVQNGSAILHVRHSMRTKIATSIDCPPNKGRDGCTGEFWQTSGVCV